MAWREKMASLTLIPMVIAYSVYFSMISAAPRSWMGMLALFGVITVIQAVVVKLAGIVLSLMSGAESRARPDERDRSIGRRGAAAAYFILMVGMVWVGVVMPFLQQGWSLANEALLTLVIAETIRHLVIIASYRQGWHG